VSACQGMKVEEGRQSEGKEPKGLKATKTVSVWADVEGCEVVTGGSVKADAFLTQRFMV